MYVYYERACINKGYDISTDERVIGMLANVKKKKQRTNEFTL